MSFNSRTTAPISNLSSGSSFIQFSEIFQRESVPGGVEKVKGSKHASVPRNIFILCLNIPFWDDVVYLYEFRAKDSRHPETPIIHYIQKT